MLVAELDAVDVELGLLQLRFAAALGKLPEAHRYVERLGHGCGFKVKVHEAGCLIVIQPPVLVFAILLPPSDNLFDGEVNSALDFDLVVRRGLSAFLANAYQDKLAAASAGCGQALVALDRLACRDATSGLRVEPLNLVLRLRRAVQDDRSGMTGKAVNRREHNRIS